VRLELRLVAEVGLVGLPNAGKSTLLAAISAARPKIAPYPFTTLAPNLGRVVLSDTESFTVADIPGLIEGAHLGHGLGIRFLRHLSRTRMVVFVLDLSGDFTGDFKTVSGELAAFDPKLIERPAVIALNKLDLVDPDEARRSAKKIGAETGLTTFAISAQNHVGLDPLIAAIAERLAQIDKADVAAGV